MGSMERKLKRKNKNKAKKDTEKEMAAKVALFSKLPDKCLACEDPFDKTNKEMVKMWNVVVREKEGVVRLYCPGCWKKAIKIIEDFKGHLEEKNERQHKSPETL
tara:strand:+ start:7959 stop:8270 length:312 start_codon:yes stop_codon:yes gene_type:complete